MDSCSFISCPSGTYGAGTAVGTPYTHTQGVSWGDNPEERENGSTGTATSSSKSAQTHIFSGCIKPWSLNRIVRERAQCVCVVYVGGDVSKAASIQISIISNSRISLQLPKEARRGGEKTFPREINNKGQQKKASNT